MGNKGMIVVLLSLACLCTILGDYFCKDHSILAMILYMCATVWFVLLTRLSGLVYTTLIWGAITTLAMFAIGYFKYHETFSATQWVGCGMAAVAIILIQWGSK
jgi:multidrug transporter EmrE-like cation transporter